jgi:3-deoxy-manno-octulosonate cytidylyltransferase (CMP-KDO synthetase)
MKIIGLIPARMGSTRLNGKALELIEGLPMIAHVYFRAKLSTELTAVHVCTDSEKIQNACSKLLIPCILTGDHHSNGTERCGEAAIKLGLEDKGVVIDIQGDEPMINPVHIDSVCRAAKKFNADIILPHLSVPFE